MLPTWIRPWLLAPVLAYCVFSIYWYWMLGYAKAWEEGPDQTLAFELRESVDWLSLEAVQAGDAALLSVGSRGRDSEVEACSTQGDCRETCLAQGEVRMGDWPPVLNCLLAPDEYESITDEERRKLLTRSTGLSYLLRSDAEQVTVAARLRGHVSGMRCGAGGRCYLVAQPPDMLGKALFISDNDGRSWRWQPQNGLEASRSGSVDIVGVDGDNVWASAAQLLYASTNGGADWRQMMTKRELLNYTPDIQGAEFDRRMMTDLQWGQDETGRLYALDRGIDGDGLVLFQVDSQSGEILSADARDGSLESLVNGPDGQLLGIYEARELERYTLFRFSGGEWQVIDETGRDPQHSLRANGSLLLMDRGRGDGRHMALSRDGGQSWEVLEWRYLRDRVVFDPAAGGMLEFGYPDTEGHFSYRWLRP